MLEQLIQEIQLAGGRAFYVGGWWRDVQLGIPHEDIDVEVFGLTPLELLNIISKYGPVKEIGKGFGVYELGSLFGMYLPIQFSVPRRETKIGPGKQGFRIEPDPFMSIKEAQRRREYTISAIYVDAHNGDVIDEWGGIQDWCEKRLRYVDRDTYVEDPSRVIRAMQLVSRFGLSPDEDLIKLAAGMINSYDEIDADVHHKNWLKWSKSHHPELGLVWLIETLWIMNISELGVLGFTPQDPIWHPEGNVLTHTIHVAEEMARIAPGNSNLMFAALCHDMGKPATTFYDKEKRRIVSPGHAEHTEPVVSFLKSIHINYRDIEKIEELVRYHMWPARNKVSVKSVRKLLANLKYNTLEELAMLWEADHSGRPPLPKGMPETGISCINIANTFDNGPVFTPIVTGRFLIDEFQFEPGVEMGKIIREAREAQIDGLIFDIESAKKWIIHKYSK